MPEMTNKEIEEIIDALRNASKAIERLPSDFKCPNGWMNIDYDLNDICIKLNQELDTTPRKDIDICQN